jgi:ribosomal protein S27AE/SAM-dependent methyltransferase
VTSSPPPPPAEPTEPRAAAASSGPEPMAIPSLGAPEPPKVPGKHERCVHCGAITFLEKSSRLRYKCGVCGKARVPVDDGSIPRAHHEKEALERASFARNGHAAWAVAAGIAGAASAVSLALLLVMALAFSPGFFVTGIALLAALAPGAFAALGVAQARKKRAAIEPALLEAWQMVAAEVIDARRELTAPQLAKILRTTPDYAETLLAHLLATGKVVSPMTLGDEGDGEVRYRSSKAPLRVAVAEEPAPQLTEAERDRLAAVELAEEEQAEAERASENQQRRSLPLEKTVSSMSLTDRTPPKRSATPSPFLARPPGQRRALSHVGGAVETAGDPALAAILSKALSVEPASDETRSHVHGFHTYPARLHPEVARSLLGDLVRPLDVVLDPFVGSGTVLVEARIFGAKTYGIDANPLAVQLARLKAEGRPLRSREALVEAARRAAAFADQRRKNRAGPTRRYGEEDVQAFDPHILLELDGMAAGIQEEPAVELRRDLWLVFSSLLTKLSRRRGDTAEGEAPKRIAAGYPAKLLVKKAEELVRRLEEYEELVAREAPPPQIIVGDARDLGEPPPVDLVLTSPPYPGNYDYLHHHELRLRWLSMDREGFDEREIGARRHLEPLGFDEGFATWRDDLGHVLAEQARVLQPSGLALLVIADSVIVDRPVFADDLIEELAPLCDLRLVAKASQLRPHFHGPTRAAFAERPRREHILALTPA